MSEAENKDLLRRYMGDVWEKGDPTAVRRFLAQSYQRHLSPTKPPLDLAAQVERLQGFRSAFPDARITVEDVIAEGDRVAFRSTFRGTHREPFFGIAPTGREVTVGLVDIIRVEDGRIVEQWGGPDVFDLLQQLGASIGA
jgi:steroid delta-isomerase-like uncharacterized protein